MTCLVCACHTLIMFCYIFSNLYDTDNACVVVLLVIVKRA